MDMDARLDHLFQQAENSVRHAHGSTRDAVMAGLDTGPEYQPWPGESAGKFLMRCVANVLEEASSAAYHGGQQVSNFFMRASDLVLYRAYPHLQEPSESPRENP